MKKSFQYGELLKVVQSMTREDELFYFFLRACENSNLKLCQLCLDAGADINIREHRYHQTLLGVLTENGNITSKVAGWFIERGADINHTGIGNSSLFSVACKKGNFDIAKYFIGKGAEIGTDDLYYAAKGGNSEIVKLLIESSDVDFNDESCMNPFYIAVKEQKSDIVEIFLKKGVNPNYQLYDDVTPLHIAVKNKDIRTATLLLTYKADVNAKLENEYWIKDYIAIVPMDIAVFQQDIDMQNLLIRFGGGVSSNEEKIKVILERCTECCKSEELSSILNKVLAS